GNIDNIMNVLGVGTESFVCQMVAGFNSVFGVISHVVAIIQTLTPGSGGLFDIFSSLLGFIPGIGGALSVATKGLGGGGGRASGGDVHANTSYLVGELG